jgi:uncharacterized damage-inducible protein DinB
MTMTFSVRDLLTYTDWQRRQWHLWFRREGPPALAVGTGPNGDGRFETIGALIRHIFSAELRYVERISGQPLSNTAAVPSDQVDALFRLGDSGRARFLELLDTFPADRWDEPIDVALLNSTVRLSPRKIVLHVLTHEIRHWAQVATLLRLQGWKGDPQDLLFSPVLGDPIRI